MGSNPSCLVLKCRVCDHALPCPGAAAGLTATPVASARSTHSNGAPAQPPPQKRGGYKVRTGSGLPSFAIMCCRVLLCCTAHNKGLCLWQRTAEALITKHLLLLVVAATVTT